MTEAIPSEIQINIKGPSELKLQISITTDKTVLDLKKAISEKSDVEADRQRLIYSGRVLKDEDTLAIYKIQSQHTIHMVKGANRAGPAASSTPHPLPAMQAGQNPSDPLTQLNSHRAFGAMAGFNPFAGMGVNVNDPNMMQNLMSSPDFYQQMSTVLANPQVLEQVLSSNPQLSAIAPQIRATLQSPHFQEMVRDPQRLQQMMQMAAALEAGPFGSGGMNPFGLGGTGGFPAPGTPSTASGASAASTPTAPAANTGSVPPLNPLWGLGSGLFPPGGAVPGAAPNANQQPNPFFNPMLMQQLMAGGLGGIPASPADARPPEERFQVQLQQLQDMGFTNASQNVRALLATGGNVNSAIEYILGGGGL